MLEGKGGRSSRVDVEDRHPERGVGELANGRQSLVMRRLNNKSCVFVSGMGLYAQEAEAPPEVRRREWLPRYFA